MEIKYYTNINNKRCDWVVIQMASFIPFVVYKSGFIAGLTQGLKDFNDAINSGAWSEITREKALRILGTEKIIVEL